MELFLNDDHSFLANLEILTSTSVKGIFYSFIILATLVSVALSIVG